MAAPAEGLAIEVAHARPDRQWLLPLVVPAGTSVRGAVLASPLARECPGLDLATAPLGVWGERVPDDRPVRAGDVAVRIGAAAAINSGEKCVIRDQDEEPP